MDEEVGDSLLTECGRREGEEVGQSFVDVEERATATRDVHALGEQPDSVGDEPREVEENSVSKVLEGERNSVGGEKVALGMRSYAVNAGNNAALWGIPVTSLFYTFLLPPLPPPPLTFGSCCAWDRLAKNPPC